MKRSFLTIAGLPILAAGIALGQAPAPNPPHTGRYHAHQAGSMVDRLAAKLNLTADQKQQAQSIFSAARQSAAPVRAQLREEHHALRAAIQSGAPDSQIDQLSNKMGPLMAQATAIRSKAFEKFYSILTPGQRTLLSQRQMSRRHAG